MELVTERLILREFQADDWPAVLAYQNDPRYLRYYDWTGRTPEQVQAFVQMFLDQQRVEPRIKFHLAVTLKETHELIGNCGIRLDAPGAHEGDIGYELNPEHWGRGYATEAARAIVRFGFAELGLHRIWSWCVADNVGSARVLEKVGMRQEGRQRHKERYKGRWWDRLLYAILEDEWRAQDVENGLRQAENEALLQAIDAACQEPPSPEEAAASTEMKAKQRRLVEREWSFGRARHTPAPGTQGHGS